jgi:hypothetical protein
MKIIYTTDDYTKSSIHTIKTNNNIMFMIFDLKTPNYIKLIAKEPITLIPESVTSMRITGVSYWFSTGF